MLKVEDFESPFAKLYLALQQRIQAKVPTIKHVALDIGQLDYYETRPAVAFPCLLIDFASANFTEEGELMQWGNFIVTTRLAFAPFSHADSITPDASVKDALQYFEIENALYKALHGYTPILLTATGQEVEICQPLTRLDAKKEMREDPYIVRANNWSTAGEDASAMIEVVKKKATLELD